MAAYGQMVASVAHEVRHPVFSLRTAAYSIAQKEGAGPQDGAMAVIREETDRIARLVDELLREARASQLQFGRVPFLPAASRSAGRRRRRRNGRHVERIKWLMRPGAGFESKRRSRR
jgi:signal transduction histidine kinase